MKICALNDLVRQNFNPVFINGLQQFWRNTKSFQCVGAPKKQNLFMLLNGCKVTYNLGTPGYGVVNDADMAQWARKVIGEELGKDNVGTWDPWMASESYSQYLPDMFSMDEDTMLNFLGIDMGSIPQWKIFNKELWAWDWRHIGAVVVALLSVGHQVISMLISQKSNDSLVTNEKGVQDKEAAKNSQSAQSNKMMLWMMPLMSVWIGFTVPCALSLYWFVGGVIRTVADMILTKHYRKVYDAEDAIRLQKAIEQDKIEAEKERIRAEKRAANPDGITENTSKKKLQKKLRAEEEAMKAAAAKEYAAKKGIVEEAAEETTAPSGIADRPYCKGRAYDPDRYSSKSTEEE